MFLTHATDFTGKERLLAVLQSTRFFCSIVAIRLNKCDDMISNDTLRIMTWRELMLRDVMWIDVD